MPNLGSPMMPNRSRQFDNDREVARENFLDTIDALFLGADIVVVKGSEGIGKTTLLRQFAARYSSATISLFIRPLSRWAYDPQVLLPDLCSQMVELTGARRRLPDAQPDHATLRLLFGDLQKHARKRHTAIYFLVDGLDDIPENDAEFRKTILDLYPWGLETFRFLLASNMDLPFIRRGVKDLVLAPFTVDDTSRFFDGFDLQRPQVELIHKTCRGFPGSLASIRRILQAGTPAANLLDELPQRVPDLFDVEWRAVDWNDYALVNALAIIAHGQKQYSIDEIARITNSPRESFVESLRRLEFIEISDSATPTFETEAIRKYAIRRLANFRRSITTLLIDDLLRAPGSDEALKHVPGYLHELGRFEDLLNYLSPQHFEAVLERTESLATIQNSVELGISTATRLQRDGDIVRFGLQRSAASHIGGPDVWYAEIEARMALGDTASAKRLAQASLLKEDRLHALAVVARFQKATSSPVDQEIREQIEQLCGTMDTSHIGDRAIQIATELLHVSPQLAIDLVERSGPKGGNTAGNLDWAFARLSFQSMASEPTTTHDREAVKKLQDRITDPQARTFSKVAGLVFGNYAAPDVLEEIGRIEAPSDRLRILRQWTVLNKRRADASEVVEYALRLAIDTTEYSPTARVLKELAAPLPFIAAQEQLTRLLAIFEVQRQSAQRMGPTDDYVDLWLTLVRAQQQSSAELPRTQLHEVYAHIGLIEDPATKLSCIARFFGALIEIDPLRILESQDKLHSNAEETLTRLVDAFLANSAEHVEAMRQVINGLARARPDLATRISLQLNNLPRRDEALLAVVSAITDHDLTSQLLGSAIDVTKEISDPEVVSEALEEIFDSAFGPHAGIVPLFERAVVGRLYSLLTKISDLSIRCRASYQLYGYLNENATTGKRDPLIDPVTLSLKEWSGLVEAGWRRVDTAFRIATALAKFDRDSALWFLDKAEEFRRNSGMGSASAVQGYSACLELAVRAYGWLLPRKLDTKTDLDRLSALIDRLPSSGARATIWSNVAFTFYLGNRHEECSRIVGQHVRPILDQMLLEDPAEAIRVTAFCSFALYSGHRSLAFERIANLPARARDDAYANICDALLYKQHPHEPRDTLSGVAGRVSYETSIDLIDVMGRIEDDSCINNVLGNLVRTLLARHQRDAVSSQQRAELGRRIGEVIDRKLPSPRYIVHDGFKIMAKAQVARLGSAGRVEWENLIVAARAIANVCDQSYVLGSLGEIVPDKSPVPAKDLFAEAFRLIGSLPWVLDRVERYCELAEFSQFRDDHFSRNCLREAMRTGANSGNRDVQGKAVEIVDLAYRIDPEFASSLAALIDDDPARSRVRREIKERLDLQALKKKLAERDTAVPKSVTETDRYPSVAWMLLGSLHSKRIQPMTKELARDAVKVASKMNLNKGYPIFAYVVESLGVRYAETDAAKTILRPVFEGVVLAVELAGRVATKTHGNWSNLSDLEFERELPNSLLVRAGERETAIRYIKDWLQRENADRLRICDPFFGPEDVAVLKLVKEVSPSCRVQILTSKKHHLAEVQEPWQRAYQLKWKEVSEEAPPDTEIIVVGTEGDGALPIHDRWWLTDSTGLRIGTSFGSLGVGRESEVSLLAPQEAASRRAEVDRFIARGVRENAGKKLSYVMFTL